MNVNISYNTPDMGIKISSFGSPEERPLYYRIFVKHYSKEHFFEHGKLLQGYYQGFIRNFHTSWVTRVYGWNNQKLVLVAEDYFNLENKKVNIKIESTDYFTNVEYLKAIKDWETKHSVDLQVFTPISTYLNKNLIQGKILPLSSTEEFEDYYVNYVIPLIFPVGDILPQIKSEFYIYDYSIPKCPQQLTPYQIAESILNGVDSKDPYFKSFVDYSIPRQLFT